MELTNLCQKHLIDDFMLAITFSYSNEGITPYFLGKKMKESQKDELVRWIQETTGSDLATIEMHHTTLDPKTKVTTEFVKKFLIPQGEGRISSSAKESFLTKVLYEDVKISFPKLFVKHFLTIKYGESK